MITYPIRRDDRTLFAFEIDNVYISRKKVADLLKASQLVVDANLRSHFGSLDDARVTFKYSGQDFIVLEPYGDSSRYWIGPLDPRDDSIDVADLKEIFDSHRPSLLRSVIGGIVGLQLFRKP
jgi:hypothetical protein